MILWIYGQSGSGKSTIIKKLRTVVTAAYLDSELLTPLIAPKTNFGSNKGRKTKYFRFARMAHALQYGIDVIVETISPHEDLRKEIKECYNPLMICVRSPRSVCEERDPKGLWQVANKEGWEMPFEAPITFDLLLDTTKTDVDGCVKKIITAMDMRGRDYVNRG